MPSEPSLQGLRDAIFKEQAALAVMDKLYCDLVVKMLKYQAGEGVAPTADEFSQWRNAVDQRIEFSRLRGLI